MKEQKQKQIVMITNRIYNFGGNNMKTISFTHKPAEVKENTISVIGDRNLINSILRDAAEKGLIKSYEMK